VEPFTHAFSSLALARAGQRRLPRFGALMLVVSGVAADLDYASYLGGAGAFLRFHRALLHSLLGSGVMVCAIASGFCLLDQRLPVKRAISVSPLRLGPALAICSIGAAGHMLLDLGSGTGVELLWPFHVHWYGRPLATNFDPWVLALLAVGLLLPLLFRLVNEEVTSGQRKPSGVPSATITLCLLAGYFGFRAHLQSDAVDLLLSREFHGRVAVAADAFPEAASPFRWRGVAVTDDTIEELEVSPTRPEEFDPNNSITRYKPQDSPALEVAEKTAAARKFLEYARVPIASVQRVEDDYRVEVRDARFPEGDDSPSNVILRIDLTSDLAVRQEKLHFASAASP
jgi:LexA-binding, inner membrane-associated putative hydrolase